MPVPLGLGNGTDESGIVESNQFVCFTGPLEVVKTRSLIPESVHIF
jgi:hypothetical protein